MGGVPRDDDVDDTERSLGFELVDSENELRKRFEDRRSVGERLNRSRVHQRLFEDKHDVVEAEGEIGRAHV